MDWSNWNGTLAGYWWMIEQRERALMGITEKEFMQQVIQLAKLRGWLVYHTHDSRRSAAGLLLVRGPRLMAAELKIGRNKLSDEQFGWMKALAQANVRVYIWRPEDWPEIEKELR